MEKKNYVVYYRGKSLHYMGFVALVEAESKEDAIKIGRRILIPDSLKLKDDEYLVDKISGKEVGEYHSIIPYETDGGGGRLDAVELYPDDPVDPALYYSGRYALFAARINSDGKEVLGYLTLLGTYYGKGCDDPYMIKRIKESMRLEIRPDCDRILSVPEDIFDRIFKEFRIKFNEEKIKGNKENELILPDYGLKFYIEHNTWDYLRFGFPKPLE